MIHVVIREFTLQEVLCLLLPSHTVYLETHTTQQSLVLSKKICRWNYLNWASTPYTPILEHLEYVTVESTKLPLISSLQQHRALEGSITVTDLTLYSRTLHLSEARNIVKIIQNSITNHLVVLDPTNPETSNLDGLLSSSTMYSALLIDPDTHSFFTVYTTYDLSQTSFFKVGKNRYERRENNQKAIRWLNKFNKLPASMKQKMISVFLSK